MRYNVEDVLAWPPALRGLFPRPSLCSLLAKGTNWDKDGSQVAEDSGASSPRKVLVGGSVEEHLGRGEEGEEGGALRKEQEEEQEKAKKEAAGHISCGQSVASLRTLKDARRQLHTKQFNGRHGLASETQTSGKHGCVQPATGMLSCRWN